MMREINKGRDREMDQMMEKDRGRERIMHSRSNKEMGRRIGIREIGDIGEEIFKEIEMEVETFKVETFKEIREIGTEPGEGIRLVVDVSDAEEWDTISGSAQPRETPIDRMRILKWYVGTVDSRAILLKNVRTPEDPVKWQERYRQDRKLSIVLQSQTPERKIQPKLHLVRELAKQIRIKINLLGRDRIHRQCPWWMGMMVRMEQMELSC